MKILPTNQTLILAADRGPGVLPQASVQALRSVTVAAAGPDPPMLYLQADYAPPDDAAIGRDAVPARGQQTPTASAVATRSSGGGSGATRSSRQAALYAQTQRLLTGEALTPHVDVYA